MPAIPRRALLTGTTSALGLGLASTVLAQAPERSQLEINVKDFAAVGNGLVENIDRDTNAFLAAINASRIQGATIRVPLGRYLINKPLLLENQTLIGSLVGGWNTDTDNLPTLVVLHHDGPAITLAKGSAIHGLHLLDSVRLDGKGGVEPQPERRFERRPAAIQITGQCSVSNVKIQYAYDAIVLAEATENGRTNIENVFIISPGNDGIYFTGCSDLPTLRNVEAWCNIGPSQGAGFRFGHNDGLHANRLFAYGFNAGFAFDDAPGAVQRNYGTLVDCSTDNCQRGIIVAGHTRLNILGGDFLNHYESLWLKSRFASVRITSSHLRSNGAPAIACDETDALIASSCEITGGGQTDQAYIRIGSGNVEHVTISSCQIMPELHPKIRTGIHLLQGTRQGLIHGNIFGSGDYPRFLIDLSPSADVIISQNVGSGPIPPRG